ncbi:MAG: hypothetical protein HEEMFOPI_01531 [Holosporales bacterium]
MILFSFQNNLKFYSRFFFGVKLSMILSFYFVLIPSFSCGVDFDVLHKMDSSVVCQAVTSSFDAYKYMNIPSHEKSIKTDLTTLHLIRDTTRRVIGTVSFIQQKERIRAIVAFRGTYNFDDVRSDLNIKKKKHSIYDGLVHSGFSDLAGSATTELFNLFSSQVINIDNTEFIFTGHSLGGSLATLLAYQLKEDFSRVFINRDIKNNQIKIITFCSPHVGDYNFAYNFDRTFCENSVRFVSWIDPVPKLLTPFGYSHCGVELQMHIGESKVHSIPDVENIVKVFYYYCQEKSILLEGSETLNDLDVKKPGKMRHMDSQRNFVIRRILKILGGY